MISRKIAQLLVKYPKVVLLVFTIFTVLIGSQIQNVYMVSDLTSYLPDDEPIVQLWHDINEEFQIGSAVVIYVEADDIRDPLVLREMDRVASKINTYNLDKGEQDGVYSIRSLAALIKDENAKPSLPGGLGGTGQFEIPEDRNLIARYIARNEIQTYEGTLFVNTYKVAVIVVQLAEDVDCCTLLERIRAAIDREAHYSDMTITGMAAVQEAIREKSMDSLKFIFPLALVFICIVIFFFQRSVKGILVVFLPLAYALILTFGILGIVQPELNLLSIAIVALLVGLGVDYSIHLLNRFSEEQTSDDVVEQVEIMISRTGKAVLLSTITTVIGFGSLMVSDMPPIITFGFGCSIGIIFAFISAMILVPCLALVLQYERPPSGLHTSWKMFSEFAVNNRNRVLVIAVFFAVMSLVVLPNIETDVDIIDVAPEGLVEIEKYRDYSEVFGGGTNPNMMLVETDLNGLTEPAVVEAIYELEEEMRAQTDAYVYSVIDAVKEVKDVLKRSEIIEKLSDFVGAEQIMLDMVAKEGFVDEQYSKTILYVAFPVGLGVEELEPQVATINRLAANADIPENGEISVLTGSDAINVVINKQLIDQQTRSMVVALLLVLAMLIVIFNSSLWGFLTMIPVGFVLMWEPGFLVLTEIPLSVVTISIASIMIGIGIDYGIHLTQRVREGMQQGKEKMDAVKDALEKTGLSLVEAAMTTTAGLGAVFFANIPLIQQFGIVVILMTLFSLVATVLILPVFYSIRFIK